MTHYAIELKKKLAQKMARVDADCMGVDYQSAYEHNLLMDSFELLQYWIEYFGVLDEPNEKLLEEMLIIKQLN